MKSKPVALVGMPSVSAGIPSIQLALLKPLLEKHGIPAQTFSLFMYLGDQIGWRMSESLAEVWPTLIGEWIWSKAAFEEEANPDVQEYFQVHAESITGLCRNAGCTPEDLIRIHEVEAPEFIDFCVNCTDWSRFGLIGFTVIYQQLLASLALARALKKRYPHIPIIMGGGSMEDDIAREIMQGCPQVDYIHCGDAEATFPQFVQRLYAGESIEGHPGIMWRDSEGRVQYAGRAPNFHAMDETPIPDFDEYLYARNQCRYPSYEGARELVLPIETSRGCWWGEKNHCTFCGLNRSGMEYRAKSVDNVIEQLDTLSRRYDWFRFFAIDNIMAPEYIEKLFGRLRAVNSDLQVHYEVRPNFSRTQLGRLQRGGLMSILPGVESFSSNILKSMRKFTTGMRNVELVKWCTYYHLDVTYNILCRFPNETEADYRGQCEIMAKIPHLQPPYAAVMARADRGSPMFAEPATQSISKLTPFKCYDYILPKGKFDIPHIAYFFQHDMAGTVGEEHYQAVFDAVDNWRARWTSGRRPYLTYHKGWTMILITDGRGSQVQTHRYTDAAATLYEYCSDARTPKDIASNIGDEPWIQPTLDEFVSLDLMLFLDGRYLSLALPENRHFDLEAGPAHTGRSAPVESGVVSH
ncbi:MAG TPA: RiPP maturation radical SAM C-methyltransferase [Candidatus Angelobacter sp.]|nr:RiPP maturation radical SAM C-methyltransferase [Candidatus Angelobacter sp.]